MVLVTWIASKERLELSKGGGLLLRRTAAGKQTIKLVTIHELSRYKKMGEDFVISRI